MLKVMKKLYPDAIIFEDWALQDDGKGLYFKIWNEQKLGKEPEIDFLISQEQIIAEEEVVEAAAKTAAAQAKLAALGLTADDLKALGL